MLYIQSSVNPKMTGHIITNFTAEDFQPYIRPEEYNWYNGFWLAEDYMVDTDKDRIEVLTNMVITANQTVGICPDCPLFGSLCDPKIPNICPKGQRGTLGIYTGRCIPADFPYRNHTTIKWIYGHTCEIYGKT